MHPTENRRWLHRLGAGALIVALIAGLSLRMPAPVAALPPRPTPAITPTATLTPSPRPSRPQPAPLRLSHIRLTVTPAQGGLWTVVEWQGGDGAWHVVEGWQGTMQGGSKRWAVFERNFGEGPFRWVVTRAPDGEPLGISAPFYLPRQADIELPVVVTIAGG
jgi:hypothetical protein